MRFMIMSVLSVSFFCACSADDAAVDGDPVNIDIILADNTKEPASDAPLLGYGESAGEGLPAGPKEDFMSEKTRILKEMENRMRAVLGEAVRCFDDIRKRCQDDQIALKPPFVIEDVVLPLKRLYEKEENAYEAAIQEIVDRYLNEMDKVIEYVVDDEVGKIWEIAFDLVGSEDVGAGYDTRTGMRDVDEVAKATIELVGFRAGRDEFLDDAEYQKRKRINLSRIYKHDVKAQGRFLVFASEPLYQYYSSEEDGIAYSVVFRSELPDEIPIEFRQAVRNRITRGGSNVYDSGFHWDSNIGSAGGVLPILTDVSDASYKVSPVFLPRLNLATPDFKRLRDYTAVRDYKTAVINADTGEILDCVSWQLTWQVSHRGAVTVDKGSTAHLDEGAKEIIHLLEQD